MWRRSMRSCDNSEGTHVSASLPKEATVESMSASRFCPLPSTSTPPEVADTPTVFTTWLPSCHRDISLADGASS